MRKIVVLFFVAFLLLLTIGCNRDSQKSNNQEEETTGISQEKDSDNNESSGKEDNKESFFIGDRYKDIILDDNHGNDERLSDYLDKPVLLSFWTSWSVESKNFNQLIKESYKEIKDNMHVVSINVTAIEGHNLEYIIKYIQAEEYPFSVFFDLDGQITKGYLVRAFPTGFIINEEGIIEKIFIGNVEKEDFLQEIEKIIAGENE